ncbi:MAG TPA: HAMP domain-containing protein, partial [Actinomycetota bacterium]|nr:HAMP domain-containing protein [Actinomycetota bacterium]
MRGRSLSGRLASALGITAALSVAGTALITFGLVRQYAEQQALAQLQRQAAAAAADAITRESSGAAPSSAMTAALRQLLQGSGDRVVYVGPTGRIISNDPIATSVATAVDLQPVLNGSTVQGTVAVPAGTFVYVAQPVPGRRPNGVAGVVLARPVGLAATVWRPVIGRVLLAGAVAVLVAVAVSLWIARRLAQPLRKMAEATHNLAAGDLAHRVPVEGDDEVADLARQFNDMAGALAEARRREHEFLAN